jgi:hypothetical protein
MSKRARDEDPLRRLRPRREEAQSQLDDLPRDIRDMINRYSSNAWADAYRRGVAFLREHRDRRFEAVKRGAWDRYRDVIRDRQDLATTELHPDFVKYVRPFVHEKRTYEYQDASFKDFVSSPLFNEYMADDRTNMMVIYHQMAYYTNEIGYNLEEGRLAQLRYDAQPPPHRPDADPPYELLANYMDGEFLPDHTNMNPELRHSTNDGRSVVL